MPVSSQTTDKHAAFALFFKTQFGEKPPSTICIFDQGDYYQCFEDDAEFLCSEFFKSRAFMKFGSGIKYVTFNRNQFESLVKYLISSHKYRLEIWKSISQTWTKIKEASPGNSSQFEDILSSEDHFEPITIMAVKVFSAESGCAKTVAIACCDTVSLQFHVCELFDNDHFSQLEAFIVQYMPRECVIPLIKNSTDYAAVKSLLEKLDLVVVERKAGEFSNSNINQDLTRLVKIKTGQQIQMLPELQLQRSTECLASLVAYLKLLQDERFCVKPRFRINKLTPEYTMKLDFSALKSLNLLKPGKYGSHIESGLGGGVMGGMKGDSLFSVLNYCRTAVGQRLLDQWIRQPLTDKTKIEERLDAVELLVENVEMRSTLHESFLRRVPDLQRLASRIVRQKAGLMDLYRLYQLIKNLPQIISIIEANSCAAMQHLVVDRLKGIASDFMKYQEMIETTIDFSQDKMEVLIKADFDEKLLETRDEMNKIESEMQNELNEAARILQMDAGKGVKLDCGSVGYHLRVTKKDEKVLRGASKKFTIIDSAKNGIRFTTDDLKDLNEQYTQLNDEYKRIQQNIVTSILAIVASYIAPLTQLGDTLAVLDVIVSLALASANAEIPFVRPVIKEMGSNILKLVNSRHPCLEALGTTVIPNDVHLSYDGKRFVIITGPNMGGKSTYIRQTALTVLMAQIGSFVPCSEAEITIVDAIYSRVGASDCIMKGVSTFMAEMLDTASILRNATKHSLVIVDELGRGTSTFDGFGIAWAIAEHIALDIGCMCMFATHFHELTVICNDIECIQNLHLTALTDAETLTLLYKVKPGVCDKSFGIHIAEMVKFPISVIEDAKKKINELEQFYVFDAGTVCCSSEESKAGNDQLLQFVNKMKTVVDSSSPDIQFYGKIKEIVCEMSKCENRCLAGIAK